jgi:hypothetical protein
MNAKLTQEALDWWVANCSTYHYVPSSVPEHLKHVLEQSFARVRPSSGYSVEVTECTCGSEHEEHTCPFSEELNDDYETMCKCCPYCRYQCAQDI